MGDDNGIGGGGQLPDDHSLKMGIDYVNARQECEMTADNPVFTNKTQTASSQITGEFHVYREPSGSDGQEVYLVAFIGDGTVSPSRDGKILSDVVLTGGNRDDRDPALAKGFFHYRTEVSVQPQATGDTIAWVCTAPTTENRETQVQDQVVYSYTSSEGTESDGSGFKVSMNSSTTEQNWTSVTDTIPDWYVVEVSDPGQNRAAWLYGQSKPWDGQNTTDTFSSWWESAYNMGGGWDDVKPPTELSKTTLQYHYIAAWRFFRAASTDPFTVTINGTATHYMIMVMMPQCGDTDHHMYNGRSFNLAWSKTLDLKALTTK